MNTDVLPIQMVDLKNQYLKIKDEVDAEIQKVIDSTAFINGPAVKEFAHDLEEYLQVKHVIPCGNGTDALQIALMALDLQPGDEVITPSFTYIATVEVMALLRLKPVFVEVNPDTFNMDIEDLKNKITPKTKAIVPVHLYGQCADMQNILKIAEAHHLPVIEDTAQALGAEYTFSNNTKKKAGTIGTIGCTSFFPSKNLGCYGDGGALFTNDDQLAKKIRMIANHGQAKKYYHDIIGVNSRLDSIQAAVLKVKLKYLDNYSKARNQAAQYYTERLSKISNIQTPVIASFTNHVFHQYTIKISNANRNELQEYLAANGIPSNIYYPVPVHLQKGYTQYGFKKGDLPITEHLTEIVLSLPIHTEMNESQLDYICTQIENFFKK